MDLPQNICIGNSQLFLAAYSISKGSVCSKLHSFHLKDGGFNTVKEFMIETRLSFRTPIQYLKVCLACEKAKVKNYESVEKLSQVREVIRQRLVELHKKNAQYFQNSLNKLEQLQKEMTFKKSVDKAQKDLEFIPINLHLQRLRVDPTSASDTKALSQEEINGVSFFPHVENCSDYDVVTVGAAANHCLGFKHGGLISLYALGDGMGKHRKNSFDNAVAALCGHPCASSEELKLKQIAECQREVRGHLERSMAFLRESNCERVVQAHFEEQLPHLRNRIDELISYCYHDDVDTCIRAMAEARPTYKPLHGQGDAKALEVSMKNGVFRKLDVILSDWKNLREKLQRSLSAMEESLKPLGGDSVDSVANFLSGGDSTDNGLEKLATSLESLRSDSDELYSESCAALLLHLMDAEHRQLNPGLFFRKCTVFSQALAICACAVVNVMTSSLRKKHVVEQYAKAGIFLQVESLLSTYGSETGMLEDYAIGIYSLSKVTCKCVVAVESDDASFEAFLPRLDGSADQPTIVIPFHRDSFLLLPAELQNGNLIRITPVLFNVGINQEQTLADKFGSTSLQENINLKSMKDAHQYCNLVKTKCPEVFERKEQGPTSLDVMLKSLNDAVHSKKRKNVEILRLSSAICRRVNGARVTSCKSAKDRTAMAVTLEQTRLLQERHQMAPSCFAKTLHDMRRYGTRLENTRKNVGVARYAFSRLQLLTFPRDYRAPEGTYEKLET